MKKITKQSNRPIKTFECIECGCKFESDEYKQMIHDKRFVDKCPFEWCLSRAEEIKSKNNIKIMKNNDAK